VFQRKNVENQRIDINWIRVGTAIFNASKIKNITLQGASIIVEYDTGETEIKLDSHDLAKNLFELVAMETVKKT